MMTKWKCMLCGDIVEAPSEKDRINTCKCGKSAVNGEPGWIGWRRVTRNILPVDSGNNPVQCFSMPGDTMDAYCQVNLALGANGWA